MNQTAKSIWTGAAAVILIAAAVTVKIFSLSSVKDAWFQPNQQRLRQVPKDWVVVRPTHFPKSPINAMTFARVNGTFRMAGRNVTFQRLISVAYSYNPGRIALPAGAPKGNYDFLVTFPKDPTGRLQLAIKKKVGYTADKETRDTDVLALKVTDPNSPGFQVSGASRQDISERNGRLYMTHMRLSTLAQLLEQVVNAPVVDKTGLTNYYDFSLVWDPQTRRQVQNGALDSETGQKILGEWGLDLEPDTASIEMLVVKKVY